MNRYKYTLIGIWILAIMVILYNVFFPDGLSDRYYYFIFFPFVRNIFGSFWSYLPFAAIYIILGITLVLIYFVVQKTIHLIKSRKYLNALILLPTLATFYFSIFYLAWAFNYKSPDLSARLQLATPVIDTSFIIRELQLVTLNLTKLRNHISKDTAALDIKFRPENLQTILRRSQKEILTQWQLPNRGEVMVRPLYPKGSLLIFSTAGIYLPFSFEGHFDPGLSHLQSVFVIAHEMGHGYGLTSEADCNFLALLTCMNAENDYIKYTGLLTYWRYLMAELRDKAPYSFYRYAYHRPLFVRNDITAIYDALDKYPDILPVIRDIIYDSYLKANGIAEGIKSYDRIIEMVIAWNKGHWKSDMAIVR